MLHLYDLSATDEKDARRLVDREFRSMQLLQKCRGVPRFRDSFQDLPDYPGELCFFTLFDPEAATLKGSAENGSRYCALRIAGRWRSWQSACEN